MDRFRFNRFHNPEPYARPNQFGSHRRGGAVAGGGVRNFQDANSTVTTTYRILCHDSKAGCVIGQAGSTIKAIRQNTGAWINVHDLKIGDEERVIEISDRRRREGDVRGSVSSFSPAQEALLMVHERIIKSDTGTGGYNVGFGGEEAVRSGMRVVARLVVEKMHVGSLLGKGGRVIEKMKTDTRTHIKVLPRDDTSPRCVSVSEEIVQIVGDANAVKHAIRIISSRLRESQHHNRTTIHGRLPSPERLFPPKDDNVSHMHPPRRTFKDEPSLPYLVGARGNNYPSLQSANTVKSAPVPMIGNSQIFSCENLVFRILCPVDKINRVVGESDGIINLLQTEMDVAVKVMDPVVGADEQVIIISSDEGPDHELFPAQEALLHIQTRIVDLVPDKENIITTRLLVPSVEAGCLEGNNEVLSKIKKSFGVNVQILPNEQRPVCVSENYELLQIQGEIIGAREALVEVTSILRSHLYQANFRKNMSSPPTSSTYNATLSQDSGGFARFHGPLVTRSTLEVFIPRHAVAKLATKSQNMLSQISELSGATVRLIENGSEATVNAIQISGTPEQAERARSLLQGFILSTDVA